MAKQELLSIVLPVYNVAPYLRKCLNSLLEQHYRRIELIIINDGATDDSPAICAEFASRPEVTLINQENHGLAYCHKLGFELAHGELVTFMDSDDYVDPRIYTEVIGAMTATAADIGACGRYLVTEDQRMLGDEFTGHQLVSARPAAMRHLLLERRFDSSICDKVFRRTVLANVTFPGRDYHDDVGILFQAVHHCHRLVHIGRPYYYYLQRTGSITGMKLTDGRLDLLRFSDEILTFIRLWYPDLVQEAWSLYYRNLKNLQVSLTMQGAENTQIAHFVHDQFNRLSGRAMVSRWLRMKDRLSILALKTHSYAPLKQLAVRLARRD